MESFCKFALNSFGGVVSNIGIAANNPTWYLCVLLICYILYWLMIWFAEKQKITPFYFFVLGMFIGIGIGSFGINLPFFNGSTARGYIGFFWGIILNYFLSSELSKSKIKALSFFVLSLCIAAWLIDADELYDNFSMILVYLIYPSIIIMMLTSKILNWLFNRKIFGILGRVSYEMYLWHSPIMAIFAVLIYLINYHPNYTYCSMILFTVLVFIVSVWMYYRIEIPITKWINKEVSR